MCIIYVMIINNTVVGGRSLLYKNDEKLGARGLSEHA